MKGYAEASALATTEWLANHLDDPDVAVIEVDEDTAAYTASHIPGAVSLDWTVELQAPPRRDFVSGTDLAQLLGSKGVSDGQTIVLYGGNNNWFAAYAYWLLEYRGFGGVRLLDGGRIKWEQEGRPLVTEVSRTTPGSIAPNGDKPDIRVFRDEVVSMALAGDGALVDVRSPAEFSGEVLAPPHLPQEQPYVPGHVPGAVNVPWSQAVEEDGSFKAADALRALYEPVLDAPEIVAYCRIGERSSHTWFVLSKLLGHPRVRNYDGSWTEYGSLVGAPVEVEEAA